MQRHKKAREPSQATNGNNSCFDYEAMVKGLISLCDETELVICLDRNGLIKQIKKTADNRLLHKGTELIGQCVWDLLLPPDLAENRKAVFSRVLESGKAIRFEDEHNGQWFDSMVYPVFDKQGSVKQVLVMGRDITGRKQAEEEIRKLNQQLEERVAERTVELEEKAKSLEDLNTVLRVLLHKNEEEKKEREQHMLSAINQLIIPYIRQIQQNCTDPKIVEYIDAIDTNLKHFTVTFNHAIQSKAFSLTPTEIEVALLIKAGKGSKDVARILKISPETVEFHRKNIRHKLGISHKKENLQSYLASLGT